MGESDDFDAFYNATNRRLLHQMYAMTGNLADAQECVQEAYARAWQHWKQVQQVEDPGAWVRAVAWRIAASRWRKARNGVRALIRHGAPEHGRPPSPDHVALVQALGDIPEAQRRAIVLHHLVGLSVNEVARETGAPSGTVKARLSRGRIDQIVEPTGATAARLTEISNEIRSCVEAGADFDLDQIWAVTGIGEETVLIRYWAPPREEPPGEGRLIVSISLVRSGSAVTSVTHGGFAQDANEPDSADHAEAAVRRLCAATGGSCLALEIVHEPVFPEPASDLPGWLTLADVAAVPGLDRITAVSDVVPIAEASFGFVCFQSNSGDAGAYSVESRGFHDPFDPGGRLVDEFIARFRSDQAATAHYETLVAEGDACLAEPSLSVENLGSVGDGSSGFAGTMWRAVAADTGAAFVYGLVVNGSAVAYVNLSVPSPDGAQIRALLTPAGERLADPG